MPLMLHNRSSCCHIRVKFNISYEPFVQNVCNIHMKQSPKVFQILLLWIFLCCERSEEEKTLHWISAALENKSTFIHWSEAGFAKLIILSNLISKKNKIAAMASRGPWHSGKMVIDLQHLFFLFFSCLRDLLNRLQHRFLGRQMVPCMHENWRNEEFSSVNHILYLYIYGCLLILHTVGVSNIPGFFISVSGLSSKQRKYRKCLTWNWNIN